MHKTLSQRQLLPTPANDLMAGNQVSTSGLFNCDIIQDVTVRNMSALFSVIGDNGGNVLVQDMSTTTVNVVASKVSNPDTLALFGLGLAGIGWSRRKKA